MPDREIRVLRCGPGQVPSAAEVESLYHAATCGSPLHESRATVAGYARLYAALLRRPDLEAVAARAPGGQLAGFAYGHGWRWAEQGDDWAAQLRERLGRAADGLDGRFAVYLLAVHPWYRRAGLGRQLLQTLLSATKTGARLITRDEPTPAMALYQRERWEPTCFIGRRTPGIFPSAFTSARLARVTYRFRAGGSPLCDAAGEA